MLKALIASYGVKELAFLRNASSPKLEPLGVLSLLPVEDELQPEGEDKTAPSSPVCGGGAWPDSRTYGDACDDSGRNTFWPDYC